MSAGLAMAAVIPASPAGDPAATTWKGDLFEHAPPMGIQRKAGLIKPEDFNIRRRALMAVLIGWVPLVLLTLAQAASGRVADIESLLLEVGAHARYLVAAPLFIIAEAACIPRLNAIARNFAEGGFLTDRQPLTEAMSSTKRLLESSRAEVVVILLAYLVVVATVFSYTADELPAWHRSDLTWFSAAGWWHALVSLPLLVCLFLGWMWRLLLWTRLLWKISRWPLRLVASHPDQAAGLSFVGHSVRAFSPVALAIATVAAGRSAHFVLEGSSIPTPNLAFNVSLAVAVVALFTMPLLCFMPALLRVWQRGSIEYGALADRVGTAFEEKWLGPGAKVDPEALGASDFSATTDLYRVVANVHAMRFVPVDLKDLVALALAMLLPFVPVALLAVPTNVIVTNLKNLLL